MMTIKEMSKLTGVSARALRYYDEIGLFHPTGKSEAGYRLYDEEALSVLQQILYFRELDIPLKTIKEIIENPALDKNHVLRLQKSMLIVEKERLERLIGSIDDALKGAMRLLRISRSPDGKRRNPQDRLSKDLPVIPIPE